MERLIAAFWRVERDFLGRLSVLILGSRAVGIVQCEWWKAALPLVVFYALEAVRSDK